MNTFAKSVAAMAALLSIANAGVLNRVNYTHEWQINLQYISPNEIPFTIMLFAGRPPAKSKDWQSADNLVQSDEGWPMATYEKPFTQQVWLPIDAALTKAKNNGTLKDLQVPAVAAFLRDQLHWEVMDANGWGVDISQFDGLQVEIWEKEIELKHFDTESDKIVKETNRMVLGPGIKKHSM